MLYYRRPYRKVHVCVCDVCVNVCMCMCACVGACVCIKWSYVSAHHSEEGAAGDTE